MADVKIIAELEDIYSLAGSCKTRREAQTRIASLLKELKEENENLRNRSKPD